MYKLQNIRFSQKKCDRHTDKAIHKKSNYNHILSSLIVAGSRAEKYIVRHSNIVLSFVLSSHMISLTNKNTVMLLRRIYFCALEPLYGIFLCKRFSYNPIFNVANIINIVLTAKLFFPGCKGGFFIF